LFHHDAQEEIKSLAETLGIDVLGFTHIAEFKNYILKKSKRKNPELSLRGVKSIIIARIYIVNLVLSSWDQSSAGRTSRVFLSGFFSDVVKPIGTLTFLLRKRGYNVIICDDLKEKGSIIPQNWQQSVLV